MPACYLSVTGLPKEGAQDPEDHTAAFTRAQEAWAELRDSQGFLGQWGGWDMADDGTAGILACWRDEAAWRHFQAGAHDRIVAGSGQAGTMEACATALFDLVLDMPGAAGTLPGAAGGAAVLRVADCRLRPGRREHFEAVQARAWRPAMAAAPGMLGGAFGRARDGTDRYLVATFWRSAREHEAWRSRVPAWREEAQAAEDLLALRGFVVGLVPQWTVPATAP